MISYSEFMRGMCNAPYHKDKCLDCGGTGLKASMCCRGCDCGCLGLPVDFIACGCGTKTPTDDEIIGWSKYEYN